MKFFQSFAWGLLGTACVLTTVFPQTSDSAEADHEQQEPQTPDKLLGRRIHNAIVSDSSLPYCAHIVSVSVLGGVVTLKGRVQTKLQKETLRKKAASVAGEDHVIADIDYVGETGHQRQSI